MESPFLCAASIAGSKNGVTTIRLTRQWEFLERKEVTSSTTGFDFKTELRGDSDNEYRIEGYWLPALAIHPLLYRVNGAVSSVLTNEGTSFEGAVVATAPGLTLGRTSSVEASEHYIVSTLTATTGETRFVTGTDVFSTGTASTANGITNIGSKWASPTVKITSLGVGTSGDNILAGSWFELHRKPKFDKTPLKLWVY